MVVALAVRARMPRAPRDVPTRFDTVAILPLRNLSGRADEQFLVHLDRVVRLVEQRRLLA